MSKTPKGFKTVIGNCTRCGGNHELFFEELVGEKGEWTHFAICPNTGQPILLKIVKTKDK